MAKIKKSTCNDDKGGKPGTKKKTVNQNIPPKKLQSRPGKGDNLRRVLIGRLRSFEESRCSGRGKEEKRGKRPASNSKRRRRQHCEGGKDEKGVKRKCTNQAGGTLRNKFMRQRNLRTGHGLCHLAPSQEKEVLFVHRYLGENKSVQRRRPSSAKSERNPSGPVCKTEEKKEHAGGDGVR